MINVLNHGFVALVETMGDDSTAPGCARTSYGKHTEPDTERDRKLTSYLIRNAHNTPLEFNQARFYMKMPIFVARQLVRHRTASINEISYRYVQAAREFYIPELDRMQKQSDSNKQGSSFELVDDPNRCREIIETGCNGQFDDYKILIAHGLSKELARIVLPCGTYTEWYWQCDLHNIFHMLGLRLDSHAQYEIRVYAEAMLTLLKEVWPVTIAEWEANRVSRPA